MNIKITVNGYDFSHFLKVRLNTYFDSFDTLEITCVFDPENKNFRSTFKPLSFADIDLHIDDQLVFRGTQINLTPIVTPESKTVVISAYSKSAVICDSCVPMSQYPIEMSNARLDTIAKNACKAFDFNVKHDCELGDVFKLISIDPSQNIASALLGFAQQRDVIITNDQSGDLLLTRASSGKSSATLSDSEPPLVSINAAFNDRESCSEYSAVLPIGIGKTSNFYTAQNPLVKKLRVKNYIAKNSTLGDEKVVATSRMARGLANAVSYECALATYKNQSGSIYKCGDFVDVIAPNAMIYKQAQFIISGTVLDVTPSSVDCKLTLKLPQSYTGEKLESYPWD